MTLLGKMAHILNSVVFATIFFHNIRGIVVTVISSFSARSHTRAVLTGVVCRLVVPRFDWSSNDPGHGGENVLHERNQHFTTPFARAYSSVHFKEYKKIGLKSCCDFFSHVSTRLQVLIVHNSLVHCNCSAIRAYKSGRTLVWKLKTIKFNHP